MVTSKLTAYRSASLVVATMILCPPASAHHHRINFLPTPIAFHGEITRLEWKNPHVYLYVDAEGDNGELVSWEIETGSTPSLARRGITAEDFREGQSVTVRGHPDRNPERKLLFAESVTNAEGTTFLLQGRSLEASENSRAVAPSLAGVWATIGDPYDRTQAATYLPLTEKGLAAAAAFDVDHDPFADCVPPPVPDSLSTPYLHEIIINDDVIVLREEYFEIDRVVYMDGRAHPAEGPRTNQGHSIGHWEGDTLVVDTALFADHGYGNGSGIPSGAEKHIVERYSLSDGGTALTIDYVLEDPEYLAAPVRDTRKWRYAPDLELLPNQCDLETARRYLSAPSP
ncbi:MAG TPA: DUF6152 family protein [Gammaproteobacteria bacterium]